MSKFDRFIERALAVAVLWFMVTISALGSFAALAIAERLAVKFGLL